MEDESVNCFLDQNSLVVFITPRRSLHTDTHSCNDEHLVSLQQIDVPNRLSKQSQVRLDKKNLSNHSLKATAEILKAYMSQSFFHLIGHQKQTASIFFKASSKKKSVVLFYLRRQLAAGQVMGPVVVVVLVVVVLLFKTLAQDLYQRQFW